MAIGQMLHKKRWLLGLVLVVIVVAAGGVLYWLLRPSTTWSSAFCQPATRVVGADAFSFIKNRPVPATGSAFENDLSQFRRDVKDSLDHAPTDRLRSELSEYHRSLVKAQDFDQVKRALNHFDALAGAQLTGCGFRPMKR